MKLLEMKRLPELYDELIAINADAFKEQFFEVAYHTLAGALYCAQHLKDEEKMLHIEQIARCQLEVLGDYFFPLNDSTVLIVSLYSSLVGLTSSHHKLLMCPKKFDFLFESPLIEKK